VGCSSNGGCIVTKSQIITPVRTLVRNHVVQLHVVFHRAKVFHTREQGADMEHLRAHSSIRLKLVNPQVPLIIRAADKIIYLALLGLIHTRRMSASSIRSNVDLAWKPCMCLHHLRPAILTYIGVLHYQNDIASDIMKYVLSVDSSNKMYNSVHE
jgi:hypothetical protein